MLPIWGDIPTLNNINHKLFNILLLIRISLNNKSNI